MAPMYIIYFPDTQVLSYNEFKENLMNSEQE